MSKHDLAVRLLAEELVSLRALQSELEDREAQVRAALLDAVSARPGSRVVPTGDARVLIETRDGTPGADKLARAEIRSDPQYRRRHHVCYARDSDAFGYLGVKPERRDTTIEVVDHVGHDRFVAN